MFKWFTGRLRALAPARRGSRRFDRSPFELLTERSHRAIAFAREEAHRFGHNYVGTEHLLLGLLRECEGVSTRVMISLGVNPDGVREQVSSIAGHDVGETGNGEDLHRPLTPRLRKILELAQLESLRLGHGWIGTEHLLLGLSREPEGVAARVLSNLGVEQARIRQETLRTLGTNGDERCG